MSTIEKTIDVEVPVHTAYDQWTQFETFPELMEGVEAVRQLDDTHVHWTAEIAGVTREWDAEIVAQMPDQLLTWRSTGAVIPSMTGPGPARPGPTLPSYQDTASKRRNMTKLNAVDLIMNDHRELERIFEELQTQPEKRPALVPVMITLLTAHSRAEEAEVYPAAAGAGGAEEVEHSQKEHLEADQLAARVAEADPTSEEFAAVLQELIDAVTHHVEEEEESVLPGMRARLDDAQLDELGRAFLEAREQHLGDMPADIRKVDLDQQAANAGVTGASSMSKAELEEELKAAAEQ